MTTPVVLYTGSQDWLADPADVAHLIPQLRNLVAVKNMPNYQHLDFIWAKNAVDMIYNDIIGRIYNQTSGDVIPPSTSHLFG